MIALNVNSEFNKTPQELQIAAEIHKKELAEISRAHSEVLSSLQTELKQLRTTLQERDSTIKELTTLEYERRAEIENCNLSFKKMKKEIGRAHV